MRYKPTALLITLIATVAHAQSREPHGNYALQGPDIANVSDTTLRKPACAGLSIRVRWKTIDLGAGRMNWSFLDSQIARVKKVNKHYMIRIMCGDNSPRWISGQWYKGAPTPWNTSAQAALSQFITLLGQRYATDTSLTCVHLTSTANYDNAEMHLCPDINRASGYSNNKITAAWKAGIEDYGRAFPDCCLALNLTIIPKSPWNLKGTITDATVANCKAILGDRATFQHNSLKADSDGLHHAMVHNLGNSGFRVGFQTVSPSSNQERFQGPLSLALQIAADAQAQYIEHYQWDIP